MMTAQYQTTTEQERQHVKTYVRYVTKSLLIAFFVVLTVAIGCLVAVYAVIPNDKHAMSAAWALLAFAGFLALFIAVLAKTTISRYMESFALASENGRYEMHVERDSENLVFTNVTRNNKTTFRLSNVASVVEYKDVLIMKFHTAKIVYVLPNCPQLKELLNDLLQRSKR